MRTINKLAMVCLGALALVACDKHDSMDDLVFVGKNAPTVYWSVKSSTVTAGDSVPFEAQYAPNGNVAIDHLEVWYNIVEVEAKEVSAPILATFSYTVTSNIETQRRISTKVMEYAHNEAWMENYGVNSMGDTTWFKNTYRFQAAFPTSNTLSTLSFGDANWDSAKVVRYMGPTFMQDFKDSIEVQLKGCYGYGKDVAKGYNKELVNKRWADYKNFFVNAGGNEKEYYKLYTDSVIDPQSTLMTYHFKDSVLPDVLDSVYMNLPFKDLIYDGNESKIVYKKSYKLKAQLRCVDKNGTAGMSLFSDIELN